jgi:phosphate starvation-inducible protein PhoH
MKAPNLILSFLFPRPTASGNKIDVYLRPLVDDLHELWNEGVSTYNAAMKETF